MTHVYFDCGSDHGFQETMIVILGNAVPSVELEALLALPAYSVRTVFLEGSALVESDLLRADAAKAVCTFIFCDKTATTEPEAYEEDKTNIMRAISITKFVSANNPGSKADIVLQLLHSANRHQLAVAACGDTNCQVLVSSPTS